jgi:hypothetical protein
MRFMNQKKRVVIVHWKNRPENPFEVFSSLKNFCISYSGYNYNTLSNYLSKDKIAYENPIVRIERKEVILKPKSLPVSSKERSIIPVVRKVKMKGSGDEKRDLTFWLSKPPLFRVAAITEMIMRTMDKSGRMDKTRIIKRKFKS